MSKWTRLPPYRGRIVQGCLNCPPVERLAPLETLVAVGFGDAEITCDGKLIYRELPDAKRFRRLSSFERMAARDPRHDWRLILNAPLRSREYQRQGPKRWVLVNSEMGFA